MTPPDIAAQIARNEADDPSFYAAPSKPDPYDFLPLLDSPSYVPLVIGKLAIVAGVIAWIAWYHTRGKGVR